MERQEEQRVIVYVDGFNFYYFSARPHDLNASKRQDLLFSANKLNPKFKLTLGKYLKKTIQCNYCGKTIHSFEEKETDVRIATQIINDVFKDNCNISVIVSASCDAEKKLSNYKARFNQSMLDEDITLLDGTQISRPANWK